MTEVTLQAADLSKLFFQAITEAITGEGNGKLLQHSCLESPMNSMKRQKDMTLKDELPELVGAQYTTREERKNSSRRE